MRGSSSCQKTQWKYNWLHKAEVENCASTAKERNGEVFVGWVWGVSGAVNYLPVEAPSFKTLETGIIIVDIANLTAGWDFSSAWRRSSLRAFGGAAVFLLSGWMIKKFLCLTPQ
jgi:hypothetical protein